jgi:bifunctional UDP-N-acetylglucosamine pyrophosphorylase/glucosamine-1-phosphate N-acetyltransferase
MESLLSMKSLEICILAAGLGSRMKSDVPKVLHPIAGKPMLLHLLHTVKTLAPARIHVVIGKGADEVKATFADWDIHWVLQTEQQGTGHALMQALPQVSEDSHLLILAGDGPLISAETLIDLIKQDFDLAVLTVSQPNPKNYGRIIRDAQGGLALIVEERDASPQQRQICEVNTGVMFAQAGQLKAWTALLNKNNAQSEYLLTDIVAISNAAGCSVRPVLADDPRELQGINNFAQLAEAERYFQQQQAEHLMLNGVHLLDPARIDIRGELVTGRHVHIDVNCVFEGRVVLGDNVHIGPHCVIKDSVIGAGVQVKAFTMLDNAELGDQAQVGPYARLRPGSRLGQDARVGNFVEVKNTVMGVGSKASHLSYLGDAVIGDQVNIGAGTITCNYDGVNKHQTVIKDRVFVGSNTSLVAPVVIGEGATIGAGSTITRDVKQQQLAVARGRQAVIDNWQSPKDK